MDVGANKVFMGDECATFVDRVTICANDSPLFRERASALFVGVDDNSFRIRAVSYDNFDARGDGFYHVRPGRKVEEKGLRA